MKRGEDMGRGALCVLWRWYGWDCLDLRVYGFGEMVVVKMVDESDDEAKEMIFFVCRGDDVRGFGVDEMEAGDFDRVL